LTSPDGTTLTVDMPPTGQSRIYRGIYRVPGNPREDGQDMVYHVTVKAIDAQGLEAEQAGDSITVKAAMRPPEPAF